MQLWAWECFCFVFASTQQSSYIIWWYHVCSGHMRSLAMNSPWKGCKKLKVMDYKTIIKITSDILQYLVIGANIFQIEIIEYKM